jgi:catechol 2,3-dioxygenase-like lactoylglutathione lyase family enzyme
MIIPGRFLEISIHSADVSASLDFYRRMGLIEAEPGDVWSHHYAVVSDGHVAVGLHGYEFNSPALCWTVPGIATLAPKFEDAGIGLDFLKTGYEEFNELGFRDPDGQMLTLLEARTFSPALEIPRPACGFFSEYRYPVRDLALAVAFWEARGFVATDWHDSPVPQAALTSDGIDLNLYNTVQRDSPALVFETDNQERAMTELEAARLEPKLQTDPVRRTESLCLTAPEGTPIIIVEGAT